ncbi:hypothetical protein RRG08_059766 [Elysia crispata]|uniref:Uncharacterized protein n=1 Tax=Elysia crispata TaxID=231223 RepID=A0AAE1BD54_9GAST|nr:hypothetical protein RRG08_059766 [Elysia crispata]
MILDTLTGYQPVCPLVIQAICAANHPGTGVPKSNGPQCTARTQLTIEPTVKETLSGARAIAHHIQSTSDKEI